MRSAVFLTVFVLQCGWILRCWICSLALFENHSMVQTAEYRPDNVLVALFLKMSLHLRGGPNFGRETNA